MEVLTTVCGLLAAWAAGPASDAFLRWRRVAAFSGRSVPGRPPRRILVLVPSRGEGARVGDLAADVRREAGTAAASTTVDLRILLDGPDEDAEVRLKSDRVSYLSKNPPGPAKGDALAFAARELGPEIESSDLVLVFDADMRLPEGFFRDLKVPDGAEVFQLPVRPAGVPGPGAPRIEALSLAEARLDDLARDAAGLPVRLRGKGMGFSPQAFRLGPAAGTRTTAEDSEATLALFAKGIVVRALGGPFAFDEPAPAASAMARSRARWLGGHLRLLATGFGDLARSFLRKPLGTFVLACDLWLRPRLFVLLALAFLAIASDVAMLSSSSSGAWSAVASGGAGSASRAGAGAAGEVAVARPVALLLFLLLLSLEAKAALAFEWLSVTTLRRHIGTPPEVPVVTVSDLLSSLAMWARAAGRALLAPSRWHRARPPA